jgi:hypothetical protein
MRAAFVVLCLLGAATISGKWNASQTKEGSRMGNEKASVRFVKSGTLPPWPGYSQAVDIRPGARIIYVAG